MLALATMPLAIPRLTGDPLSSNAWRDQGLSIVALAGRSATLRPYREFGATARLGWTDTGLAARVQVTDATSQTSSDPERPYEGDSVELYLGSDDGKEMVQIVAAPGSARPRLFDYRSPERRAAAHPVGRSKTWKTSDGYVVQILLPWTNLGLRPEIGLAFGARVAVNDAAPDRDRQSLAWNGDEAGFDFFRLPKLRLAEIGAAPAPVTAWASPTDDLGAIRVNVVAEASQVGKPVRLGSDEKTLMPDGPRAVTAFDLPIVAGEKSPPAVTLTVPGGFERRIELPDLGALRREAFEAGLSGRRSGLFSPGFTRESFPGEAFPPFAYRDQAAVERAVGPIRSTVQIYDADGDLVERATREGRYGAVVRVESPFGGSGTIYRTLWRGTPPEKDEKADRDWWHALRKRRGDAIHYETSLTVPNGPRPEPGWPLIVYLHGSGGGDAKSWEATRTFDGPMGEARRDPGFPFATLALRSPGGWYPPAVRDAIDEAMAKGDFDKNRVILTGFSMGGMGTWACAYDDPGRFAALVPVGGRNGDAHRMPLLKGIPVWVFNGAQDDATLPALAREAVRNLRAAHGKVAYTEFPGASHVDSLRLAYARNDLYAWMARQRRK